MSSVRNTAAEDKSKESEIKLANRKLGMNGDQVSAGVREKGGVVGRAGES